MEINGAMLQYDILGHELRGREQLAPVKTDLISGQRPAAQAMLSSVWWHGVGTTGFDRGGDPGTNQHPLETTEDREQGGSEARIGGQSEGTRPGDDRVIDLVSMQQRAAPGRAASPFPAHLRAAMRRNNMLPLLVSPDRHRGRVHAVEAQEGGVPLGPARLEQFVVERHLLSGAQCVVRKAPPSWSHRLRRIQKTPRRTPRVCHTTVGSANLCADVQIVLLHLQAQGRFGHSEPRGGVFFDPVRLGQRVRDEPSF